MDRPPPARPLTVRGLLAGCDGAVVTLGGAASWAVAQDTAALLELEHGELEVELGTPTVRVGRDPHPGEGVLELVVRPEAGVPELMRDGPDRVRVVAGSVERVVDGLSLLRTLRVRGGSSISWRACGDVGCAIDRVATEVATTAPALHLHGVDWSSAVSRAERELGRGDPVHALQRVVAEVRDAHTSVRAVPAEVPLPVTARVVAGRLVVVDVPAGTVLAEAGVVTGSVLATVDGDPADVAGVWARWGAPAHLRPWLVGRRLLSAPAAGTRRLGFVAPHGASVRVDIRPVDALRRPAPVSWHARPTGTGVLVVRGWDPADADTLDIALEDLDGCDRLLVDLRGNVGGSLVAAASFRRRFVAEPLRLGSVRTTVGDGSLGPHVAVVAEPSDRRPWVRRVRFLTDELTYSASEDAILGLSVQGHVDVVGRPSGGGSGRPRTLPLLDDVVLTVSTALTYDHAGRCVEGTGIHVDVPLGDVHGDDALAAADRDW